MLTRKLENILEKNGIEYFDVIVKEGYKTKYRFLAGGADGSELLQLYSMSKGITVTLGMRLIERGLLSLDDRVSKFFPSFKSTTYVSDGKILPNPNEMTLKNLFTMTSGMSYDVEAKEILEVTKRLGDSARLCDYVPAFAKIPLSFPSGEDFQYSLSHDLLAAIIEKIVDTPFAVHAKNEIFIPMEMNSSTFENITDGVFKKLSCDAEGNLSPAPKENALLFSKSYTSGGAGLNSTVEDYSKFVAALTNNGKAENGYQLLSESGVKALTSPLLPWSFIKNNLDWLPSEYSYGLGVRVRTKDTAWGLSKGEFGWDGAAGSFWLSDPNKKISVVMGMNILSWELKYRGIHFEILEQIYRYL